MVPGREYYFVGGKDYFVDRTDGGTVVMRLEDIGKVLNEQANKLGFSSFRAPPFTLVRRGTVSINKWSGDYGRLIRELIDEREISREKPQLRAKFDPGERLVAIPKQRPAP